MPKVEYKKRIIQERERDKSQVINVSRSNPLIYLGIYNKVKEQIIKGEIAAGDLLPTEAELMETYQCSRTTVRHVISLLRDDGIVTTVQGKGSVVSGRIPENFRNIVSFNLQSASFYITAPYSKLTSVVPSVEVIEASETIARILQIEPHSMIYLIISSTSLDGETILDYRETYANPDYMPGLNGPGLMKGNIYQILRERYHIHNIRTEDRVVPDIPDEATRKFLNVSADVPIFLTKRLISCSTGPFAYSVIKTRGDLTEFAINRTLPEGNGFG